MAVVDRGQGSSLMESHLQERQGLALFLPLGSELDGGIAKSNDTECPYKASQTRSWSFMFQELKGFGEDRSKLKAGGRGWRIRRSSQSIP